LHCLNAGTQRAKRHSLTLSTHRTAAAPRGRPGS
jgi:hypothetical protein